jgi:hypothetical protein
MKNCENCKQEQDGSYGSGRFCSTKCARGFSTKAKRKEINEKVSVALTKPKRKDIKKICPECASVFYITWKKRNQIYCSVKCAHDSNEVKQKLSNARIKAIKNGVVNGNSIKMSYPFNSKMINCDSKVEYACLNYFEKLGASQMRRCTRVIAYDDDGLIRKFLPDFEIEVNGDIYIVEAKSHISVKSLDKKWRNYNKLSKLKMEVLKLYCTENGLKYFWFTKDLHRKYYNSI